MPDGVYLGFDFGYKRIGVAVGQCLTGSASPLTTLQAKHGQPQWEKIEQLKREWNPAGFVVGLPTCIDDSKLYTTEAAKRFAKQLGKRFSLPVYLVDERLSTVEARSVLFEQGGYRHLSRTEVDSIAACIILEQWLREPNEAFFRN